MTPKAGVLALRGRGGYKICLKDIKTFFLILLLNFNERNEYTFRNENE